MLRHMPLPTWWSLLRALWPWRISDEALAEPWWRAGEVAGWLSRSAWSLALIAQWRSRQSPESVTVWIPDFFCNASLRPLRASGARLVFYPVTDDLAPDMAACRSLAEPDRPDIVVLVHYFGRPTPAAALRDFCRLHEAWLVEDAAHVLRPVSGVGTTGDFVLYSPHKHLPVPEGAVLVVRPDGAARLGEAVKGFEPPTAWPAQLQAVARAMGCSRRADVQGGGTWLAKRVLQKCGVGAGSTGGPDFVETGPGSGTATVDPLPSPALGRLGRQLLPGWLPELPRIARWRARHLLLWDAVVPRAEAEPTSGTVVPAERPDHREWTPYLASYSVSEDQAEPIHDRWRAQGLPVTTWPDLPPEVIANRETHACAWRLRHTRLYQPVHQGLSVSAVLRNAGTATRVMSADPDAVRPLSCEWGTATRQQWHDLEGRVARSNLVQTWAYGEAKAESPGWRVRRAVFSRADRPIAFVQVLQRTVLGVVRISRINRGPVFLPEATPDEVAAVWGRVARLGNLWRGQLLTTAPELPFTGTAMALMAELGFRQRAPEAWESIWLDLSPDLNTLRAGLNRKWRNMLVASEKSAMERQGDSDASSLEWMIGQQEELMAANGFSGISGAFLRQLHRQFQDDQPLLVLKAVHEGEIVAGICLARHGQAATYLLGWNGDRGRTLKANQFLLWQAVCLLKQAGCLWFDLGGLDEERTPGIAAFKLGLSGERYQLVGEYWKW